MIATILSPRRQAFMRRLRDRRRALLPERPKVTLYYRSGDPYSRLCAQLLPVLQKRLDIELEVVLVPEQRSETNAALELAAIYARLDAYRIAPAWGLDFPEDASIPTPDLCLLADAILLAVEDIDAFIEREHLVAGALWRGDAAMLRELGKRLPRLTDGDAARRLKRNGKKLRRRGHYMSGMWHFRGEWYWAVDRLNHLGDRLRGLGLIQGEAPLLRLDAFKARLPELPQPLPPMEYYYSFRSPYSYLSINRVRDMARRFELAIDLRPILPMVMRGLKVPRAKRRYIVFDSKREADRLGIPFGRIHDPLGGGVERCLSIYPLAQVCGRGLDFAAIIGCAVWAGGIDLTEDANLREITDRLGLDWAAVKEAIANAGLEVGRGYEEPTYARKNREAMNDLGLWGVPCFRLGPLVIWGQDRLWLLQETLRRTMGE